MGNNLFDERFIKGIGAGLVLALGCGLAYWLITSIIPIETDLWYVAMGYAIGYGILTYSHGVQKKFAVLAVICTALSMFIGDGLKYFGLAFLFNPVLWRVTISITLASMLSLNIHALLKVLFRVLGLMTAYHSAEVN